MEPVFLSDFEVSHNYIICPLVEVNQVNWMVFEDQVDPGLRKFILQSLLTEETISVSDSFART